MTNSETNLRAVLPGIYPGYSGWSGKRQNLFVTTTQAIGANFPALPLESVDDWKAFFALSTPAPDSIPVSVIVTKLAVETFDKSQPVYAGDGVYAAVTGGRFNRWTKATKKAWVRGVDATIAESGIPWSQQQVGNTMAWLYDDGQIDDGFAARVNTLRTQYAKTIKRHKTQKAVTAIAALAVVVAVVVAGPAILAALEAPGGVSTALTSTLTSVGVPAAIAPALATGLVAAGTDAIANGARPKDVADASTNVLMDYVPPVTPESLAPKLSTGAIVAIAAGGLTLAGLAIYLATKTKRNPQMAKELEPLAVEARKYKTAEEFVNSPQVSHDLWTISKNKNWHQAVTKYGNKKIPQSGYNKIVKENLDRFNTKYNTRITLDDFFDDNLPTESQLTDIWNKAHSTRRNPNPDEWAITDKDINDINEAVKDGRDFWARALIGASLRDNIKGWTARWVNQLSPGARSIFNAEKAEIITTGRYWKE